MMRATTLILSLAVSTVARAQSAGSDPAAPAIEEQRPVVQLQITQEQQHLLDAGEISMGKWFTGGVLSSVLGFGVGQAIQGRYRSRGWMFTVGDSVALTVTLYGAARCCGPAGHKEEYAVLGGLVALIGLRIWQTVDAWLVPPAHNRKVRALRTQLGLAPPSYGLFLAPAHGDDDSGGVAGLSLSF